MLADDRRPHRLATYGSLGPGQPNHHVLASIEGRWMRGRVRGRLVDAGWGSALGYPGLILDGSDEEVEAWVLESTDLSSHWSRLDRFEGPGYRRTTVTVRTENGDLSAFIYVLAAA